MDQFGDFEWNLAIFDQKAPTVGQASPNFSYNSLSAAIHLNMIRFGRLSTVNHKIMKHLFFSEVDYVMWNTRCWISALGIDAGQAALQGSNFYHSRKFEWNQDSIMSADPRKIMQYARVLKPTINLTSEASWLNCPAKCSFDVCKSGTQQVYIYSR